jgi:phosphoribosyl 1,2-cyclic phosphodiesterase
LLQLAFLGTGGGRNAVLTQVRWTGGIRIIPSGAHLHIDPGPGALIRSLERRLNPQRVRVVLISHAHPDHYNDGEIFVEAMTAAMTKRQGTLVGPRSVLHGNDVCEPAISKYHQSMVENVVEAKPGLSFEANSARITVVRAQHTDPDAVGYKLTFPEAGTIGYTSDTEYFQGLGDQYKGARLLILCAMRPRGDPWKGHMSTDDAASIVEEARPEKAVLTHFGMKMLQANPWKEAAHIQERTGTPTIAAYDGMILEVGEEIREARQERGVKGLQEFIK